MSDQFLARSRTLVHPSGVKLTTPLLVPSFSSKGFPRTRGAKAWAAGTLDIASEWLTDTMLLSAYDIHYGYLPKPSELPSTPELTIVDSGGYEAGLDEDLSAAAPKEHEPKPWSPEQLKETLDQWPDRFAAIFVSYDHPLRRLALAEQVAEAKRLFANYPKQMHSLLLKPETREQELLTKALKTVADEPHLLSGFHTIGVTEKELGATLLDRMLRIAELRLALDRAEISAPIQVFGALDPISSCLFFLAGAEIFDGLTWLRFAYHEGLCVYRANYGALKVGITQRDALVDGKTMADNLNSLRDLELAMRRVALDKKFEHFPHHQPLLSRAFDDLRVKLKGRS